MKNKLLKISSIVMIVLVLLSAVCVPTFAAEDKQIFIPSMEFTISSDGASFVPSQSSSSLSNILFMDNEFSIDSRIDFYEFTIVSPFGYVEPGSYEFSSPSIYVNSGYYVRVNISYNLIPFYYVDDESLYPEGSPDTSEPYTFRVVYQESYSGGDIFDLIDPSASELDLPDYLLEKYIVSDYSATFTIENSNIDSSFNPFSVSYNLVSSSLLASRYSEVYNFIWSHVWSFGLHAQITNLEIYDQGFADGYADGFDDASLKFDFTDWLVTAVGGFLNFEIFPNFSLAGMLGIIICLVLVLLFLKFFAGG